METLTIKEFQEFQGQKILVSTQIVSFDSTASTQSYIFHSGTSVITISSTQSCYVALGKNPKATIKKGIYVHPQIPITFNVDSFTRLAVIEANSVLSYWRDIDFPIIARTAKVGQPTPIAITSIDGDDITLPQWAINDFSMCEGNELVHEWKEGSTIYWHLHLLTNGLEVVDKYMAFELKFASAVVGGVLETHNTILSGDILIPANTPDKSHLIMSLGSSTLTDYRIASHIYARLKRVGATGDDPANDPWIPMLQVHIECDSLGSRTIQSK
jgi:hypothetical protein